MPYRVKVDWTYSTTASATTAATNINSSLSGLGRPETVTRNGNQVVVEINDLSQSEALDLRNSLTSAWATGTRTAGKASVVLRP